MVYCGKPSKSCRQCRNRNIKCDKKIPSCGQCLRAHLSCPGYPNPQHLTFRDETLTTILKLTSCSTTTTTTVSSSSSRPDLLSIPIHPPLVPPIFHHAKHLFLTHHFLPPSSRLSFLLPYRPPRPCATYFSTTVRAVMFASLFREMKCPSVLRLARKSYSEALRCVNAALKDRTVVKEDVTLAAVLLLDLFERLVAMEDGEGGGGGGEGAVKNHLKGAVAIFKLRGGGGGGGKQFEDAHTMSMFRYLSFDITLNCLRSSMRVPDDFLSLYQQAREHVSREEDDNEWQFMDLMIRLAQVKAAALREGSISASDLALALRELDYDYFRILYGSPGYLYGDVSEEDNNSPLTTTRGSSYKHMCPGPGPGSLETRHTVLVRKWLDELHLQNVLDVTTAT